MLNIGNVVLSNWKFLFCFSLVVSRFQVRLITNQRRILSEMHFSAGKGVAQVLWINCFLLLLNCQTSAWWLFLFSVFFVQWCLWSSYVCRPFCVELRPVSEMCLKYNGFVWFLFFHSFHYWNTALYRILQMRTCTFNPERGIGAFGTFPLLLRKRCNFISKFSFNVSLKRFVFCPVGIYPYGKFYWWSSPLRQGIFPRLWCYGIEIWFRKLIHWSYSHAILLYVTWVLTNEFV